MIGLGRPHHSATDFSVVFSIVGVHGGVSLLRFCGGL
jgi:hypothetical protein